jgi:HAD superfamily hydrolase (TIGR01490 family)
MDFFDVDHTLTRRSTGARYIALAIRKGLLPLRLLFIVPYYSLTYRLGLFRLKKYADGFPYLQGLSKESLEVLARECFESRLKKDLFPEAEALIREKTRAGRRVVLATSSLDIIVKPLADYLGVTDLIATRLEFKDGVCTGMVEGVPLFRADKRKRVLQYIQEAGEKLENCSFYSDSIYDLPLLEVVGEPVAVNPDFRLMRIARAMDWRIMDFRKSPPGSR